VGIEEVPITMERILRFGVVGCGRIAGNHLRALASDNVPAELVAVADVKEDRARETAEQYRVPYYLDYHEMLARHPDIDVIDILTPTGYHARHVVDLARYGKHFVVEKPMALQVSDCDRMIAACRQHGCRLFVVKQNRYNRAVVAARRALDSERFGKLVMGTVRVRWKRDHAYYARDAWRGTWELDGGVMAQQASHHLDLLQWFMGPVERLQCQIATRLMKIEVEDTAVALFRFESGALGVFEATTATRPTDLEASLSILGEHGSVILGGNAVNQIEHWQFDPELPEDAQVRAAASQGVPNVYGHGHGDYLAAVVRSILSHQSGMVEGAEGRKNVVILTALYESAARGGVPVRPDVRIRKARIGRRSPRRTTSAIGGRGIV
jgi:UDP-N-acetyl-2-amino-2-deoxyglucuronate dehydrogenase